MRHRLGRFPGNWLLMGLLLAVPAYPAKCQMCDAPNSYRFTSTQYFASSGKTNITAFVSFSACPGRNGYVDYQTADGTAVAFQDYTPTNGTLFFPGWYSPALPVQIQINPHPSGTSPKTILLVLTANQLDPKAAGLAAEAQLIINFPPPPNLSISPATNDTVRISWVTDGTDVVLEKAETLPAIQWTEIRSVPRWASGQVFVHTDAASGNAGFYRLRRPQ